MNATETIRSEPGQAVSIVIVGEALLDVDVDGEVERICPDSPAPVLDEHRQRVRPGGAALAAVGARAALGDGGEVHLLTALGDDPAGWRVRSLLTELGVTSHDAGAGGTTPQKIRFRAGGQTILRLDRGRGPEADDPTPVGEASDLLAAADAILVADYGLGLLDRRSIRRALGVATAPIVWDPHPRSGAPIPGTAIVTPNLRELHRFVSDEPGGAPPDEAAEDGTRRPTASGRTESRSRELNATIAAARSLRRRWRAGSVTVTRGPDGALFVREDGPPVAVPAPDRAIGDPCGAGDVFAATLTVAIARGELPTDAVEHSVVAAAAHVAGRGSERWWRPDPDFGSTSPTRPPTAAGPDRAEPAQRVGRDAPAVRTVAAGGCFDLLHAGHVATLRAARALGDRLVVLLNSDRSVRRLKGPDRPLQGEADRRAVLLALDCVDDVIVFDERTPARALERLRPDLFVKGGDYTGIALDEADVLARWGGEVVTVPYLRGRSTTRLVEEARRAR